MNRTTIAGAVAITALGVALVLGTQVLGIDSEATPMVTTVLGFIGLLVTQIVGSGKAESTEKKVSDLNADLRNGTFERLLREAIEKVAADSATNLTINTDDTKEGEETG